MSFCSDGERDAIFQFPKVFTYFGPGPKSVGFYLVTSYLLECCLVEMNAVVTVMSSTPELLCCVTLVCPEAFSESPHISF